MISAKVIADSISPTGSRLTTVEAKYHRFILPEVLTHRAFSRNTASNRAIPTKKLIEQVRTDPAMPLAWGSNQPGMQSGLALDGADAWECEVQWLIARDAAADHAEVLAMKGVHKEVVNRLLEPFLWTTQIITSTEAGWDNFFNQRCSDLAQPEIWALSEKIYTAMFNSVPVPMQYGDWHLPYVDELFDRSRPYTASRVSAARCARVSYLTHDGKRDIQKDLDLYEKLITADPPHYSPLEHVATPGSRESAGNLDSWAQLRHLTGFQ